MKHPYQHLPPCLKCGRPQDDPLHGGPERGGLAHDTEPRIEQHDFDAGERRHSTRRMDDRRDLVRKSLDR